MGYQLGDEGSAYWIAKRMLALYCQQVDGRLEKTQLYYLIKEKLNATKKSRDEYIEKFIRPIDEKLKKAGLKFHMKGRTKSIHSIWQKMKKQHCGSGRHLRLVCQSASSGFALERKNGMLAGLFHHHGHVSAQPQTVEGLVVHPQKQRLRKLAYHGPRAGEQMGGSANPNRTNGRNSRTRIGCALEIQRY